MYNGVSIVRWKKRKPCREPFVTYAIVWLKMFSIVAVRLILLTLHASNGYHGGANIMTEAYWCSSIILIQSPDLALDPVTFFTSEMSPLLHWNFDYSHCDMQIEQDKIWLE